MVPEVEHSLEASDFHAESVSEECVFEGALHDHHLVLQGGEFQFDIGQKMYDPMFYLW
jgi:hypothetical protein